MIQQARKTKFDKEFEEFLLANFVSKLKVNSLSTYHFTTA